MRPRHSALPKLELSPCWEPDGQTSPAAERGTKLDAAYRAAVEGDKTPLACLSDEADRRAVEWAVRTTHRLANGADVVAHEAGCRVRTPGIEHTGTVDALCPAQGWSVDLKTGRDRDYGAQMAAYALGLMEQMFDQRWTTHLLFADQQQVVSLNWTYESARARVESILARVPAGVPTEYVPSEYCSWCARRDTCPVRLEQTQNSLALVQMAAKDSIPQILARFLADPELSGKFILGWRMVEKEIAERVELFLRDALVADPTACSCVRLVQQQGAEWFGPEAIEKAAPTLGVAGLVAALGGRVGGKKWREVCAAHGVPVDEADAQAGATIKKLVAAKAAPPQKTPRLKKAPKQKAAANA